MGKCIHKQTKMSSESSQSPLQSTTSRRRGASVDTLGTVSMSQELQSISAWQVLMALMVGCQHTMNKGRGPTSRLGAIKHYKTSTRGAANALTKHSGTPPSSNRVESQYNNSLSSPSSPSYPCFLTLGEPNWYLTIGFHSHYIAINYIVQ